jgi:hypothetical protein
LTIAGLSKLTFIGLVLVYGKGFLGHQAGVSIAVDGIMVVLFAIYLLAQRRDRPGI